MPRRTSLLIRCSRTEALTIRAQSRNDRRTVSSYVLNIILRAASVEGRLMAGHPHFSDLNRTLARTPVRPPGPRTALQIHCSVEEANQIRRVAGLRETTISGFVLHALHQFWKVSGVPGPEFSPAEMKS